MTQFTGTIMKTGDLLNADMIAESANFTVLDAYERNASAPEYYQTEDELERELVRDLTAQGYEFCSDITSPETMLDNLRLQIQSLNNTAFSNAEWNRLVETWLDHSGEGTIEKTRKVHRDYYHAFKFDDGHSENIYLFDKKDLIRNKVQVIRQFEQTGIHANRYDVTILINGLPLVQIELKKRGISIQEAFNQIHRYSKESFNSENSLYKFLQLFVISNGSETRYFANTTKRDKNSFDFTMHWARCDNSLIRDLKDFTATFFQKNTLLNILFRYSVLDCNDTLLVMRPYQIAATERILWKIHTSFELKKWNTAEGGGYIWHTTGSGKTLTSFKAAQLATGLKFIDKVIFVVDRKDLDEQTMKEYRKFAPDSINGSNNTAMLRRNLEQNNKRIVVTTIQKLNILMKSDSDLKAYDGNTIFIFDECHRSQFGEAQKNLYRRFRRFCQFGFTGTPIFHENAYGDKITENVFGHKLHSYVITDAIRDRKVLKFKVDYNDVRPKFRELECEQNEEILDAAKTRKALMHPGRIAEVSRYVLQHFHAKTHRLQPGAKGFNALFAVDSIDAAKLYYESLNALQNQDDSDKLLNIATIFSYADNENREASGIIRDEGFEPSAMNLTGKEFLNAAINDYNGVFRTSFSTDGDGFHNYYRDLAKRVRTGEIDLLIVVGMFLTGFDAPTLNTLFVDRNLRHHNLIQAFSRTNRILNSTKGFGNIVTFRNLEQATVDAIRMFADDTAGTIVLAKSFLQYMNGYTNEETGESHRGFVEIVNTLTERFPDPDAIESGADQKEFAKLFGEYLKIDNLLCNFDEFFMLKDCLYLDMDDPNAVMEFKQKQCLDDDKFIELRTILESVTLPSERAVQDYRSAYAGICDQLHRDRLSEENESSGVDWNDVEFEVDLLKSQDIDLDYILELIFDKNKSARNKEALVEDIRRLIRGSLGHRARESLIVDFINRTDLDLFGDRTSMVEAFLAFAKEEQNREMENLIATEGLNSGPARDYILLSVGRGFASENGNMLDKALPRISPLKPEFHTKKNTVFKRISEFVEKFKGLTGKSDLVR